jgi:hypothetical protein
MLNTPVSADPIPNSEAKPAQANDSPLRLRSGQAYGQVPKSRDKIRSSPGFIDPDWLNQSGFSFELVPDMARAIRPIRD